MGVRMHMQRNKTAATPPLHGPMPLPPTRRPLQEGLQHLKPFWSHPERARRLPFMDGTPYE